MSTPKAVAVINESGVVSYVMQKFDRMGRPKRLPEGLRPVSSDELDEAQSEWRDHAAELAELEKRRVGAELDKATIGIAARSAQLASTLNTLSLAAEPTEEPAPPVEEAAPPTQKVGTNLFPKKPSAA